MPSKIDGRPGQELGLTGRYADEPAFQIVDGAHNAFLTLTSRLISLEYGSHGDAFKSQPLWGAIDMERCGFAERLAALGSDAVGAATLSDDIRRLNEVVDGLVTKFNAEGLSG